MRAFKKVHLLNHLLLLIILSLIFLTSSGSEDALTIRTICGQIPTQQPQSHMLLCKSQKLYFKTSLGLFPISSVNFTANKLLVFTISHPCCSLLSSGFPKPQQPNSFVLFNCSTTSQLGQNLSPFVGNHTCSKACDTSSSKVDHSKLFSSCFLIDHGIEKLEHIGFHPRDLNCLHYRRVYRQSLRDGYEFGTRILFDIPNNVPNICSECEKPNGNCGVGLRCICHPKECKDKVISKGNESSFRAIGNIFVSLVSFLFVINMV